VCSSEFEGERTLYALTYAAILKYRRSCVDSGPALSSQAGLEVVRRIVSALLERRARLAARLSLVRFQQEWIARVGGVVRLQGDRVIVML
jgi:hypothetical protein